MLIPKPPTGIWDLTAYYAMLYYRMFNRREIIMVSKVTTTVAMKEEIYQRILALRERGWSIPALLLLGIQAAEEQLNQANSSAR